MATSKQEEELKRPSPRPRLPTKKPARQHKVHSYPTSRVAEYQRKKHQITFIFLHDKIKIAKNKI